MLRRRDLVSLRCLFFIIYLWLKLVRNLFVSLGSGRCQYIVHTLYQRWRRRFFRITVIDLDLSCRLTVISLITVRIGGKCATEDHFSAIHAGITLLCVMFGRTAPIRLFDLRRTVPCRKLAVVRTAPDRKRIRIYRTAGRSSLFRFLCDSRCGVFFTLTATGDLLRHGIALGTTFDRLIQIIRRLLPDRFITGRSNTRPVDCRLLLSDGSCPRIRRRRRRCNGFRPTRCFRSRFHTDFLRFLGRFTETRSHLTRSSGLFFFR